MAMAVVATPMVGLAMISCLVVMVQTTCGVVGGWTAFTAVPAMTISPMLTNLLRIPSITQTMAICISMSSPTVAGVRQEKLQH